MIPLRRHNNQSFFQEPIEAIQTLARFPAGKFSTSRNQNAHRGALLL